MSMTLKPFNLDLKFIKIIKCYEGGTENPSKFYMNL